MAKPKTSTRRSSGASSMSPEQREAAEAAKHAPVSLPSGGSFDREALQEGLDKVVDRQPHNREAEVNSAIEAARTDAPHTQSGALNAIPGHKLVDVEVQLSPGSTIGTGDDAEEIGKVVVTEQRQVVDPDAEIDPLSAASGGQPVTGNRSEVLSVADSEGPLAPAASGEHAAQSEDEANSGSNE